MIQPTTVDFETEAIERRPAYPPKPVGFSIKRPGDKHSHYYAWGHPTGNNCTFEKAQRVLKSVWRTDELLFHNAKFDVDVAETHMDVPKKEWHKIHDTMYLLFLHDPYMPKLSLKPAAHRLLGMAPSEQDAVNAWLMKHVPEARRSPSTAGAYICRAPGGLVGRYADGDVLRTERLFKKLYRDIQKRSMVGAYDRERRLMPILLQNEREGIRCNVTRLRRDYKVYSAALDFADNWLRRRLKAPDLDFNKPEQVADALHNAKIITDWVMTPTGKRSTAKKNMTLGMFENAKVACVYGYRQRLDGCLIVMRNWLAMAGEANGMIHTSWNQVRQAGEREKGTKGARTGRMSCSPPLMNIAKDFSENDDGYVHPDFLKELPELPLMRCYLLPDEGEVWIRRDYNQQELRILAHFEDGPLMQQYNDNPRLDIHQMVKDGILEIAGLDIHRRQAKVINFGEIYGMGVGTMAERMHVDVITARKVKVAKRRLMPKLAELMDDIMARGRAGEAIRTWGGREYYTEPPAMSKKYHKMMTFEYKLLNYLIQGSAADCTKQSIINYDEHPKRRSRFLVTVHDENNISAARKTFKQDALVLREAMQAVPFDVPMLSDGEYGPNWADLKDLKEA